MYNWESNFKSLNALSLSVHKIQAPFPNSTLLLRKLKKKQNTTDLCCTKVVLNSAQSWSDGNHSRRTAVKGFEFSV